MSTGFDATGHRGRQRETPLSELPDWGLDIMRGLYGQHTIDEQWGREMSRRPVAPSPHDEPPPLSPLQAELEALDAIGSFLLRLVRRR